MNGHCHRRGCYQGGYGWVLVSIWQVPTAFLALGILGKKFAILSRKLNVVTVTEFLRHRYESPWVVILSSAGIVLLARGLPQGSAACYRAARRSPAEVTSARGPCCRRRAGVGGGGRP